MSRPPYHDFLIGALRTTPESDDVAVFKRRIDKGQVLPIVLLIRNDGQNPFNVSVFHSLDNEYPSPGDVYAATTFRVNGTLVANITVVAGGVVEAIIESTAKDFFKLSLTAGEVAAGAQGVIQVLPHRGSSVDALPRIGIPDSLPVPSP